MVSDPDAAPDAAAAVLRRLVRFGLPSRVGSAPPAVTTPAPLDVSGPLPAPVWSEVLQEAGPGRAAGFLLAAIEAGALPTTDEQYRQARELHASWCRAMLHLERELLTVVEVLEVADVEVVVLKGTAHAHLLYDDPAWRMFGDNDVLVPSHALTTAVAALAGLGYHRQAPEQRPGFEARFGKGVTLAGPRGEELDLHRTLLFGTFGFLIDESELFRTTTTLELGGHRLRALGPETRLLHGCYHAALGDPDPVDANLRDLVQQLARSSYDPARVLRLVAEWQALPVLARALGLCRSRLGVQVEGPLAEAVASFTPTSRERRAVASYVGPNRHYTAKVLASLPYLADASERAAFLRAALFPERSFRRAHGSDGLASWLRRGSQALRRGRVS